MDHKLFREDVEYLIDDFFKKHELAKTCGGEYVRQNDKAQVDAIDLVCKICDTYISIFK